MFHVFVARNGVRLCFVVAQKAYPGVDLRACKEAKEQPFRRRLGTTCVGTFSGFVDAGSITQ